MVLSPLLWLGVSLLSCVWSSAVADVQCEVEKDDFCKCSTSNLTLDLRQIGLSFP